MHVGSAMLIQEQDRVLRVVFISQSKFALDDSQFSWITQAGIQDLADLSPHSLDPFGH
jgi:hypothetical protein